MSPETAVATEPTSAAEPTIQKPALKPGTIVRVVKAFGSSKSVTAYATVLTIAPAIAGLIGADGEPTITVALFDASADASILGSGNWHNAFQRIADVAHASHEDVTKGRRGIYWVDVLDTPADAIAGEKLPEIEGRESSVFSRKLADEAMEQPVKTVPKAVEPVPEGEANAGKEPIAEPESVAGKAAAEDAPADTAVASSTTLTNNDEKREEPA